MLPNETVKVIIQTNPVEDAPHLVEVNYFSEGGGTRRTYYRKLKNAVAEYATKDEGSPMHKFVFPAHVGTQWNVQFPGLKELYGVDSATVTATAVEEVSVPAGTFQCLKMEVDVTQIEQVKELYQWLAPGVGLVRQHSVDTRGTTTVLLRDFRKTDEDFRRLISPPEYHADFDSLDLDDWMVYPSGHWSVCDGALCSTGEGGEMITLKPYIWRNCRIKFRVRLLSGGDMWVSFRGNLLSEPRGYSYFQLDDGTLKIRHHDWKAWKNISENVSFQTDDAWHTVECVLSGRSVQCFVDGQLRVITERCPMNIGMVGFRTLNTKVEIDDFQVRRLDD
jgi:hypothetical protein